MRVSQLAFLCTLISMELDSLFNEVIAVCDTILYSVTNRAKHLRRREMAGVGGYHGGGGGLGDPQRLLCATGLSYERRAPV